MYRIKGFHTVSTNYRITRVGGTMIPFGEKINSILQLDSGLPDFLSLLVEIGGNKFITALACGPPRFNKTRLA